MTNSFLGNKNTIEGTNQIIDHVQLLMQGLPSTIEWCMLVVNRGRVEIIIHSLHAPSFILIVDNKYTRDWLYTCSNNGIVHRVIDDYTGDMYWVTGNVLFTDSEIEGLVGKIRSMEAHLKHISIYNPVRIEVQRMRMSGSEFINRITEV